MITFLFECFDILHNESVWKYDVFGRLF